MKPERCAAVDPALVPFLDALAELLAADAERRLRPLPKPQPAEELTQE